jgi:dienelactone hydrolase
MIAPVQISIRDRGLVGTFYLPATTGRFPGVLVLGGSGGGIPSPRAEALAREGFAALALAYFGCEGRPEKLMEIPLEYFFGALDWLKARPEVSPTWPAVMGSSRGGELALLIASHFPELSMVISISGTGLMHRSPPRNDEMRASWSIGGKALPYLEENNRCDDPTLWDYRGVPVSPRPRYVLNLQDSEAVERAAIPAERVTAPVLFLTGGDDQVWPAAHLVEIAIKRMRTAGKASLARHICYPGAGHTLALPGYAHPRENRFHAVDGGRYLYGGTAEADEQASKESWMELIQFLRTRCTNS